MDLLSEYLVLFIILDLNLLKLCFQQYEVYENDNEGQEPGIAFTVPRDMADGYINNKREVYQFRFVENLYQTMIIILLMLSIRLKNCDKLHKSIHHPILIQVYPHKLRWPISPTPTLHLVQFKVSSFSKPTLLLSFSTCIFHDFFGRLRFLLPFTSNSNAFLKTYPSSLLNTSPYHLTPFAFSI